MFHGSPLPLSPDVPLSELLALTRPARQLGAWIRGSVPRLRIHRVPQTGPWSVLASADLGFLLRRCEEVAIREGHRTIVLPSEAVIEWRALQVATATPYLPGLERLAALFPGLRRVPNGFLVPVGKESAEEVLSMCLKAGLQVSGSRIVYARAQHASSSFGAPRTSLPPPQFPP